MKSKFLLIVALGIASLTPLSPSMASDAPSKFVIENLDESEIRSLADGPDLVLLKNEGDGHFVIYWSGDAAPVFKKTGSASAEIVFVDHSNSELRNDASDVLNAVAEQGLSGAEVRFKNDASGLILVLPESLRPLLAIFQPLPESVPAPVEVAFSTSFSGVVSGRLSDSSPFKAAGAMRALNPQTYEYWRCTTGFAVVVNGIDRLLSAAHCDETGEWAWYTPDGTEITSGGSYVNEKFNLDSMLMRVTGASVGKTFIGTWTSSSWMPVKGSMNTAIGDYVCASGANSGEHCSLQVQNYTITKCFQYVDCPMFEAYRTDGGTAVSEGDSGGPVYSLRNDGGVTARGITIQFRGMCLVQCSNLLGNVCYSGLAFVPIQPILSFWNATLKVS
ncbi:MAG: hypothetical protein RL410_779 [Actinomycetota bacterium]|jgi:hypothetical protein